MSATSPDSIRSAAFLTSNATSDNETKNTDGRHNEVNSIRYHGTQNQPVFSKQSIAMPTAGGKPAAELREAVKLSDSSAPSRKFVVGDSNERVGVAVYVKKTDISNYLPAQNEQAARVLMNSQFESLAWQENGFPVFNEKHVAFFATAENLHERNLPVYKDLFEGPDGFVARAKRLDITS